MKKLGFLVLALVASKSAVAGEVGAPIPQLANSTALLAVAIAEAGAAAHLTAKDVVSNAREQSTNDLDPKLEAYVNDTFESIHQQTKMNILEDSRYLVLN